MMDYIGNVSIPVYTKADNYKAAQEQLRAKYGDSLDTNHRDEIVVDEVDVTEVVEHQSFCEDGWDRAIIWMLDMLKSHTDVEMIKLAQHIEKHHRDRKQLFLDGSPQHLFAVLNCRKYKPWSKINFIYYTEGMSRDNLLDEYLRLFLKDVDMEDGFEWSEEEKQRMLQKFSKSLKSAWIVTRATKKHIEAADYNPAGLEEARHTSTLLSICKAMAIKTLDLDTQE